MSRVNIVVSVLAVANGLFVIPIGVRAQVCEPTVDGFGCVPVTCSNPGDLCIPTVLHLDIDTGAITAIVCECMSPDDCHVEFGDATPFPVGECPASQTCEVFGSDTDNDGIDDQFFAACDPSGACCVDIDDGPISYDTCVQADQSFCDTYGGVFHGFGSTCAGFEACCLTPGNGGFCGEADPFCCVDSGGTPQGAGSTCDEVDCLDPIPTVSEWGLMAMAALVLGAGALLLARRRHLVVDR